MNKLLTLLLLSLPLQSSSFSPATWLPIVSHNGVRCMQPRSTLASSSTSLAAKKRRRRKAAPPDPTTSQSDELPNFDDPEEIAEEAASVSKEKEEPPIKQFVASTTIKNPTPIKRGSGLNAQLAEEVGGNVDGLDEDTILEAMRGKSASGGSSTWVPPTSIQDTLSDRGLEKFMDFDKMIEQDGGADKVVDLPDFDEVIARRKQREAMQEGRVQDAAMLIDTQGMGKKAAKNAQRRAEAIAEAEKAEAEKSPFEGLEDLNILKLLENGAWVGIGLLVLWEFYINSPFFDRAAPLIPVVYDEVVPPGM